MFVGAWYQPSSPMTLPDDSPTMRPELLLARIGSVDLHFGPFESLNATPGPSRLAKSTMLPFVPASIAPQAVGFSATNAGVGMFGPRAFEYRATECTLYDRGVPEKMPPKI